VAKKIGFVLSGGGAKGSFQAGVLNQLTVMRDIVPDLIVGTSIGSINGAVYSYAGLGVICEEWKALKERSQALSFKWSMLYLSADGIFSMAPLVKNYLKKHIKGEPEVEVMAVRVDLRTGITEYVSNLKVDNEEFIDAVQDSATIPLFMHPRDNYMDGGLREVFPVNKALEEGCKEIHAVVCTPWSKNPQIASNLKKRPAFLRWYEFLRRSVDDVMNHDVKYNDLYTAYLKVKSDPDIKIWVYAPNYVISGTLEFSPKKIEQALSYGEVAEPVEIRDLFRGN
jgi:NTE family protein